MLACYLSTRLDDFLGDWNTKFSDTCNANKVLVNQSRYFSKNLRGFVVGLNLNKSIERDNDEEIIGSLFYCDAHVFIWL